MEQGTPARASPTSPVRRAFARRPSRSPSTRPTASRPRRRPDPRCRGAPRLPPNPVARMLTQRQTMTIGVLTPQALSVIFSNPFFGAFSEGVALAAEEHGYGLHFISPLHGSLARAMSRATVDGVVAIGLSDGHPRSSRSARAHVPIVLVDSTALPEHGSVEIDDVGGARAAAGAHPRPRASRRPHPRRRAAGAAAGPTRTASPAVACAATARRSRRSESRSTTTMCWSAPRASKAASRAQQRVGGRPAPDRGPGHVRRDGHRRDARVARPAPDVPGDVSVVGFDDIDLAPHVDPPLTTVHQPIRRKGEEAVRLLLSVVERRDLANPEHRRLETRLIVRASTGPVPSAPGGGGRRPRLRSDRRAIFRVSVRLATTERTEARPLIAAITGRDTGQTGRPPPTSVGNRIGTRPSGSREEQRSQ